MAASAWKPFKAAKKNLGNTTINLSSGVFKLVLVRSGATMMSAGTSASTWASLKTDGVTETSEAGGYSSSGENLANVSWTFSGNNVKFDAQDWSLSVTADLTSIKAAIIRESAGDHLVCYATLSTAGFNLSNGNKLTIQMNAAGIFVLS